jgi:hypothetical protein
MNSILSPNAWFGVRRAGYTSALTHILCSVPSALPCATVHSCLDHGLAAAVRVLVTFCHYGKICEEINLKQERLILAHGFRDPGLLGSVILGLW